MFIIRFLKVILLTLNNLTLTVTKKNVMQASKKTTSFQFEFLYLPRSSENHWPLRPFSDLEGKPQRYLSKLQKASHIPSDHSFSLNLNHQSCEVFKPSTPIRPLIWVRPNIFSHTNRPKFPLGNKKKFPSLRAEKLMNFVIFYLRFKK